MLKPVIVTHHLAKFNGHRSCGSRDMYLICDVALQDRVIEGPCDFMEGSTSLYHAAWFGCHIGIVIVEK